MKKRFKEYRINGSPIKVAFRHKSVHIPNSDELKKYLSEETDSRTMQLISLIKTDYLLFQQEAIDISEDSMAVEIWAHLFAQNFLPILKTLQNFNITEAIAEKLLRSAETIDLGETSVDNNRKYWDWLSSHKDFIVSILFKTNKYEN